MSEEPFKSDPPRRSVRASARTLQATTASSTQQKRKPRNAADDEPLEDSGVAGPSNRKKPKVDQLEILLRDPKSTLTKMDITDVVNSIAWELLSEDARARLSCLLPPTAFQGYEPTIEPTHPSRSHVDAMEVDGNRNEFRCADTLDPSVFTDPHFLASAHTFQDHMFTGWMTDAHLERVRKFESGVADGSLHAPWKDEAWQMDNDAGVEMRRSSNGLDGPPGSQNESNARAGEAAELKLADLVKGSVIKVGDVLAYKRNFSQLEMTIEKDVIIESINHRTYTIKVLVQSGTSPLPPSLLERNPRESSASTQRMEISSPSQLETGVLDLDGRVERGRRPNGNAWKCFTVWRWREDAEWESEFETLNDGKGGRENHGTLFYLRGNYYHDR